jgi:hypothetical protein
MDPWLRLLFQNADTAMVMDNGGGTTRKDDHGLLMDYDFDYVGGCFPLYVFKVSSLFYNIIYICFCFFLFYINLFICFIYIKFHYYKWL